MWFWYVSQHLCAGTCCLVFASYILWLLLFVKVHICFSRIRLRFGISLFPSFPFFTSENLHSSVPCKLLLLLHCLIKIVFFFFSNLLLLLFRSCWFGKEMSKQGAFDLAFGVGGKIGKDDVLSAVDKYTIPLFFFSLSIYVCFFWV